MSRTPVGVDIAKAKFDVAVYLEGKYKTKVFANTPTGIQAFQAWLLAFPEPHVCLEATSTYGEALSERVADAGVAVSMVNPARIAAFARTELARTKTDKGDAKLIARFCALHTPALWQPLPRSIRELKALVRRLENLLEMHQMEDNRLLTADPAIHDSLRTVLTTLAEQIAQVRTQIAQHIDNDPDLRNRRDLLDTIPGLGKATIPVLLSVLADPGRFASAKQCAAYAGLTPAERQSGQYRGQTRLSKTGDALLRKALYLTALVAWRYNPLLRAFCERLKTRGMNGKAIVCAAMRKLLHIAFGVLKSNRPFDPNIALAGE
jgi:transposase